MLDDADLKQLAERGLSADEVRRQVRLLTAPPRFVHLERACTVGDGIRQLSEVEISAAIAACERARDAGRLSKFVPASGAATRLFQSLLAARKTAAASSMEDIMQRAERGDADARDLLTVIRALPRFAFADDLRAALSADGLDLDDLVSDGRWVEILDYLLTPCGLDYAALPKALVKFHDYPDGGRAAFEEHLADTARWTADAHGTCRVHFTVSPEQLAPFTQAASSRCAVFERRHGIRYECTFSTQKPSTDTIAVDLGNELCRTPDGRLLFRPGGHGALIENLNDLRGDVVVIENIDNVVPDRLKDVGVKWKQVLAGHVLLLQEGVRTWLDRLAADSVPAHVLDQAEQFARDALCISPAMPAASPIQRRDSLRAKLGRPLRVCGMVRNAGEPGGGPFWVRGADGAPTSQIVESAQVDRDVPAQVAIFSGSTHFNPVELACALRDAHGQPFDLRRFVDQEAVFMSRKSSEGRELTALERPGLWNGAMADWITVFVEIPSICFNPVKTVVDLLRPEHQPE